MPRCIHSSWIYKHRYIFHGTWMHLWSTNEYTMCTHLQWWPGAGDPISSHDSSRVRVLAKSGYSPTGVGVPGGAQARVTLRHSFILHWHWPKEEFTDKKTKSTTDAITWLVHNELVTRQHLNDGKLPTGWKRLYTCIDDHRPTANNQP